MSTPDLESGSTQMSHRGDGPGRLGRWLAAAAWRGDWLPLVVAVALILLPPVLTPYLRDLAMTLIVFSIFTLSLELLLGTTGLISFGHAAFLGIGAYVTVLGTSMTGPGSMVVLLPLAIGGAALYALIVGALSLRTKGVYFLMVTLAFAQMAYFVFHDTALAGGSDGMYLYFRPVLTVGGRKLLDLDKWSQLYGVALGMLFFTYAFLALLRRSRFGHALAGIRTNEQRMRAAGYRTYGYKLAAFVIGCALAGMAGFLMAAKNGVVNPAVMSWHMSAEVLLMTIFGGVGSLRGAVVGAVVFTLLKELYQSPGIVGSLASDHWQLTLGFTIILFVAFVPRGIVGLFRWRGRRRQTT